MGHQPPFLPHVDEGVVPPTPVPGMVISIAGVDQSSYYKSSSLRITETLGSRSTCNFQIFDATGALSCPVGSEVIVTFDEVNVFSGTIESTDTNFPSMDYTSDAMFMNIRCVDWNQLLDRKLVAKSFAADGQTFGQIVRLIIDEFLADDGVVPGQIQNGGYTDRIVFQYETVNSCLSSLAEAVGYVFYIDYNKQLHFRDRIDVEAPFSLTALSPTYRSITVKQNRSQYRNRQYLRGGLEVSPNRRTEEFAGDNDTRTFTVALPVGAEPEVWVNRGSQILSPEEEEAREELLEREEQAAEEDAEQPGFNIANIPQRVGTGWVRQTVGLDSLESPVQWSWNVGDNTITQNSDELVLRAFNIMTRLPDDDVVWNNDRVRIIYRPLVRVLARSQDDDEIAARQAIEGGSGIYEAVEEDERIEDSLFARTKVEGLLTQLGHIPKTATVVTDEGGIRAGQFQTFVLPKLGLVGYFLIESFSASDRGDETLRYSYKALDGESLGGWQSFFKRLINRGRKFIITEGETVMIFADSADGVTLTDNLPAPDTSNTLGAYTTDAYTVCLVSAGSQVGSSYPAVLTYSDVIRLSFPIVYYRCDETSRYDPSMRFPNFWGGAQFSVADSSGNANGGTASFIVTQRNLGAIGRQNASPNLPDTIQRASCFRFPGGYRDFGEDPRQQSRVIIPPEALDYLSDVTIGFWLQVAHNREQEQCIFQAGATAQVDSFTIIIERNLGVGATGNPDKLRVLYFDTADFAGGQGGAYVEWSGLDLRSNLTAELVDGALRFPGTWNHIAVVRDQTNQTFELFINSQSMGLKVTGTRVSAGAPTNRISMSNLVTSGMVVIGQRFPSNLRFDTGTSTNKWLVGRLDEFAIFPSVLPSATIAEHAKDRSTMYHVGSLIPPSGSPPPPTFIEL